MPPSGGPSEMAVEVETRVVAGPDEKTAVEADIVAPTGVDVSVEVNTDADMELFAISPANPALVPLPSVSVECERDR